MKLAENVLEELWFGEDDAEATRAEASRSLSAKLAELEGVRPFPVAIMRLIEVLNDPDFDVREVRTLVEGDPSLAVQVLRVANSPLFARAQPCASIENAVFRLGSKSVKEIASAIALMKPFKDIKGAGKMVRDHCAAVAGIARGLARRLGHSAEGLFLMGLLHDIGQLLLLQSNEKSYALLFKDARTPPENLHLGERSLLGYDHAVLGGHVLTRWGFSDGVARAVAWHHQPARAQGADSDTARALAVLRLADDIEKAMTHSTNPDEVLFERLAASPDGSTLDLEASALTEAWTDLRAVRTEALRFFTG